MQHLADDAVRPCLYTFAASMNATASETVLVEHDRAFLIILKVTAFLAANWIFGRSLKALRLPPNVGCLAAGVLFSPRRYSSSRLRRAHASPLRAQ